MDKTKIKIPGVVAACAVLICVFASAAAVAGSAGQKQAAAPPSTTGTLSGTVTDHHGVPLGGAQLVVQNMKGGGKLTGNTDGYGAFVFDEVEPGEYTITASARGLVTKTEKTKISARHRTTVHIKLSAPKVEDD